MTSCDLSTQFLAMLGAIVLFFFLLDRFWGTLQLCRALLAPLFLPNEETNLVKRFGSWALITGSTDGVGRAYAFELARRGFNVVLVSRTQEKLQKTATELETAFAVKTKTIAADFSCGPKAVECIKEQLGDLPIGVLVNNVGKQYDYPMYLDEIPEKDLWDIIMVNVGAVTLLSRLLIESMKTRGRGAIVNISSGSELQPLPLMTVYAATKSYVRSFTAALRCEYAGHGIFVQHLSPMFINTKMNHFSSRLCETSTFVPDANTYAKYAASTLGKMENSTGYWAHGLQYFFTTMPPEWIRMYVGAYINKSFRREYFKNKQANVS